LCERGGIFVEHRVEFFVFPEDLQAVIARPDVNRFRAFGIRVFNESECVPGVPLREHGAEFVVVAVFRAVESFDQFKIARYGLFGKRQVRFFK
jgi:hypothetical protein